jgi:hypothetical protein
METRLDGADRNIEDGGTFFEREIMLVVEKEDGSAGGRHVVEQGEEGGVGWFAELGSDERFGWSGFEGLPATGAFEVGEGNARGDPECPGAEDGGLAQKGELAEDLERGLLEDVVDEVVAGEVGNVAAQRRMCIKEELFESCPVAGLSEEDEQG